MSNVFGSLYSFYFDNEMLCTRTYSASYKRPLTPFGSRKKKSHSRYKPVNTHPDNVLIDYVTTYGQYICHPDKIKQCIDMIILPPTYEQLRILQELQKAMSIVDLEGLEGVAMKLLISHDEDTLHTLLQALVRFQENRDLINAIIRFTYEISTDGSHESIAI